VSELFPPGITDVRDLPYKAFEAIHTALIFLGFGELPEEEQPPRRIWLDSDLLDDWFTEVKRKRKEERDGSGPGPIEDPVRNDAARSLIAG